MSRSAQTAASAASCLPGAEHLGDSAGWALGVQSGGAVHGSKCRGQQVLGIFLLYSFFLCTGYLVFLTHRQNCHGPPSVAIRFFCGRGVSIYIHVSVFQQRDSARQAILRYSPFKAVEVVINL